MTAILEAPSTKRPVGRPPQGLNWPLALAICEELRSGYSLSESCRRTKGAPDESAVHAWLDKYPEFEKIYAQARRKGWIARADRMCDLAARQPKDQVEATWQRTQIDTLKWQLSKMLPRIYGDKLDIHHAGSVTVNVTCGVPRLADVKDAVVRSVSTNRLTDADVSDDSTDNAYSVGAADSVKDSPSIGVDDSGSCSEGDATASLDDVMC